MSTTEPTTQAELITAQLTELGMTVSQFARELGVRPSFIHAIKTGKRRLTRPATVEKAAEVLGISADMLFIAGGHLPPDAWTILQHRPELVQKLRLANDMLAAREAQHGRRS